MILLTRTFLPLVGALLIVSSLHAADLPATADTWVHGGPNYRTNNYGAGEFLKVRAQGPRIALIQFDASALPLDSAQAATLELHVTRVVTPGMVQVQRVTGAWTEDIVTFDTMPALAPDIEATLSIASSDGGATVSVDISALVAEWTENPNDNFGFAITAAAGSSADIYFGTRDVGTPPTLAVEIPNTVTVSQTGGNYSDPLTAAQNAYSGDVWCVNATPPANPCTMTIDAGIFILPETFVIPDDVVVAGAGKTATVLVADRGVELAVEAPGGEVRDLTIINRQDAGVARAVGVRATFSDETNGFFDTTLSRVAVRAEGAIENVGFETGTNDANIIRDSDIAAVGGQNAFAIDGDPGSAFVDIYDSRISATGGSERNEGIGESQDNGGGFHITDSVLLAEGGRSAFGVAVADEEGGTYVITGGTISASAQERAIAVAGGEYSEDMKIIGTRVVATSPEGEAVGVGWYGATDELLALEGVFVHSSGVAVSQLSESGEARLEVLRSQLVGATRAIEIEHHGIDVRVEGSVLQAEFWAVTASGEDMFTISESILDGASAIMGGTATCTDVLDGDYKPLGSDCSPIPP